MISVAATGCFDCLHVGHLDLLEYARSLGNHLIVGINSDESVKALKGKDRPIVSAWDRRRLLMSLTCVDNVMIFHERTAAKFLERFSPDIWVKGGQYSLESIDPKERAAMDKHGGKIVFFPHINHRSTTDIVERIRGRNS